MFKVYSLIEGFGRLGRLGFRIQTTLNWGSITIGCYDGTPSLGLSNPESLLGSSTSILFILGLEGQGFLV